jgi:O-antigen ligase
MPAALIKRTVVRPARSSHWWRRGVETDREAGTEVSAVFSSGTSDSAVPFWALMAFTFILLVAPQTNFPVLAPLRIALVTAALAVLAYLFDRFVYHRPFLQFTREIAIVVYLLGWAILTIPLSYWPGGSLTFLFTTYVKTLLVFLLLTQVINSFARLRIVAWGLSLMAVPLALGGIKNLITGTFIPATGPVTVESRILGYDAPLTGNPNDLALVLNLILPLCIALFLGSKKPGVRAALLGCICLDTIGVIATFSRGGFLTLGVIVVSYVWTLFKRGQRHWAFLAIFLALVALPLLPSGYVDRLSTITDINSDPSGSAQARWGDTLAALQYVAHHPIVGAGVGMNVLALNEVRGPTWTVIHNVYLQYAVDLGLPGLILFLLLLTGCLKGLNGVRRRTADVPAMEELFYLAEGLRISLIAFAVAAIFHPVGYHFYFYYIAGLALAAKTICTSGERKLAAAVSAAPDPTRGRR